MNDLNEVAKHIPIMPKIISIMNQALSKNTYRRMKINKNSSQKLKKTTNSSLAIYLAIRFTFCMPLLLDINLPTPFKILEAIMR